jgi:hypothetical protein
MLPLDYVLAAALLTAPPDATDPPGAAETYACLCPMMQHIASGWEILDHREVRYVLTRNEDYKSDMGLLRRRHYDLSDAPPLHDCVRFPPRSAVTPLLAFNRTYRENLEKLKEVERGRLEELESALQEADRLYQIWDDIRDTRCEYYYITVRRQALKRVRDAIGIVAYHNGNYPPHVPIWRFQKID